jgi:glycogen operon protein
MWVAGDEFGRTQLGNNNAYCQDNAINWLDWSLRDRELDEVAFVRRLVGIRQRHPELRREVFLEAWRQGRQSGDVQWLHPAGHEMREADWNDPHAHALGVVYQDIDDDQPKLLLLFNASDVIVDFMVPLPSDGHWLLVADTADIAAEGRPAAAQHVRPPRSLAVYERGP